MFESLSMNGTRFILIQNRKTFPDRPEEPRAFGGVSERVWHEHPIRDYGKGWDEPKRSGGSAGLEFRAFGVPPSGGRTDHAGCAPTTSGRLKAELQTRGAGVVGGGIGRGHRAEPGGPIRGVAVGERPEERLRLRADVKRKSIAQRTHGIPEGRADFGDGIRTQGVDPNALYGGVLLFESHDGDERVVQPIKDEDDGFILKDGGLPAQCRRRTIEGVVEVVMEPTAIALEC